jgi:hypothetical protein
MYDEENEMYYGPSQEAKRSDGAKEGGRVKLSQAYEQYPDQLAPFLSFLSKDGSRVEKFEGTIIRLPLRTELDATRSEIKKGQSTTPEDIQRLFDDFLDGEIKLALLFLKNVKEIDFTRITVEDGAEKLDKLGRAKKLGSSDVFTIEVTKEAIRYQNDQKMQQKESFETKWKMVQSSPSFAPGFISAIKSKLHNDRFDEEKVTQLLKFEKLSPVVQLAVPLGKWNLNDSRVFTLLPVPIGTQFPLQGKSWSLSRITLTYIVYAISVNASFALSPARDRLKNEQESFRDDKEEYVISLHSVRLPTQLCFDHFKPSRRLEPDDF